MAKKLTLTDPVVLPAITTVVLNQILNLSQPNESMVVEVFVRRGADFDHQYALEIRNGEAQCLGANPYPTAQDPFIVEWKSTEHIPDLSTAFTDTYQALKDGVDNGGDGFEGLLTEMRDLGIVPPGTMEDDV